MKEQIYLEQVHMLFPKADTYTTLGTVINDVNTTKATNCLWEGLDLWKSICRSMGES